MVEKHQQEKIANIIQLQNTTFQAASPASHGGSFAKIESDISQKKMRRNEQPTIEVLEQSQKSTPKNSVKKIETPKNEKD